MVVDLISTYNMMKIKPLYQSIVILFVLGLAVVGCSLSQQNTPACNDNSTSCNQNTSTSNANSTNSNGEMMNNLTTYSDDKVQFSYKTHVSSDYVGEQTWPPKVEITNGTVECTQSFKDIAGKRYCVEIGSEGAAGSLYITYTYQWQIKDTEKVALSFVLRFPQCMNYPDNQQEACRDDQEYLDIDMLVSTIADTLVIK